MHGSRAASAGTLIVGAGQSGLQLAVSLREGGYTAPITLAGAEAGGPYQRPPLSKAFLAGTVDEDNLALRAAGFYTDHDIDIVPASRIVTVSPDRGDGGSALIDGGRVLRFERLALTTGSRPRRLTVPGADLFGVCYLRSVDDAGRLRRLLEAARDVVVIGGGFIGLEVAAAARRRGLQVTVVESSGRLLKRVVAPPISEFYRQAHEKRGVHFRMGCGVTAVHGDGNNRVTTVELSDGTQVAADIVIVGIGVEPRIELARQLGLDCARGIIVDDRAQTSIPSVVAAGDCTVQPHPQYPETLVGLESVQNAVDQAKVAAATILGLSRPPAVVPWFWSDQADLKLQIAGLSTGYDEFVVRGDPATESFSVLYYRQLRLIAVDAVNQPHDFMAVKRALALGVSIPAAVAGDTRSSLKSRMGASDQADERLTVGVRP
ncbi:FAD-dependent oxidoreductase [Cryobacterium sp. PH31-O1]|uniref:NAD(P)/FAD-dependent oxidoreductase n=1 Tax=Cryobacterium sp. PH31-O1 TaxID=3046306 RepID=UPI0024BB59F8|nr:FAD-dependent oxidoreductase [Cryobacterium sp. PH31-O1]MDJ0339666.1 FAD-dependent oxidoreductase [Cryobacterium sp. PH31-O1]